MNKPTSKVLARGKTFVWLLFFFGLSSMNLCCNGNKTKNNKNRLKVSIDLVAYRPNSIQVFFKTNADDAYSEALSLRKNIKASPAVQKLVFELPLGIKAKNIRIDLGENSNQNDSIRVENISFRYKELELNGAQGLYKSWFTFNPNLVQGKDSLTYHLKRANGIFDPQLNGNRVLNAKLVKLFPPDIYEK